MMSNGVDRALTDANLALDQLPDGAPFRSTAFVVRGVAHALLGATDRAEDDITTGIEIGQALGSIEEIEPIYARLPDAELSRT